MTRKNSTISSQIINTLEISNEPWGIKDKSSCFLYGNDALIKLQNINNNYDYEGKYDSDIPWKGNEFSEDFIKHDLKVMENEESVLSLETHVFGRDKVLSSYFQEKFPLYDDKNTCIGILFHVWKIQDNSLTRLFHNKLPASIMFQSPTHLFTEREWEVVFLFLQKYSRKQISQLLNIADKIIGRYIRKIYNKLEVSSDSQLEEYCRLNGFDLYAPKRFLLSYL
ncbi:helix-turn-helix transcriptional regulator [Photorhabdus temperata]|uniref:Response regulator containing a CheY-like receiver domain and an HTH DNA-binding protein n=1 Tax=Photorhabdus temperata subsp. temperata Meg1 TaxID=1393735 RepID=A0A081RRD6_PHOTE|nr:LuxR C-terminal-related transcriptional regulator [Photorhabdus temperata]KER01239.1 response regulator containing a CheY-like receiver domain and an HTH DNA-binding protein [Photorhabdus temperata subsp. temperata Meg1]